MNGNGGGSFYNGSYARRPGKHHASMKLTIFNNASGEQVGPTVSLDKNKRWETVPNYLREVIGGTSTIKVVHKGERDPRSHHIRSHHESTYFDTGERTYSIQQSVTKNLLGKWQYHRRSVPNIWKDHHQNDHKKKRKNYRAQSAMQIPK